MKSKERKGRKQRVIEKAAGNKNKITEFPMIEDITRKME